MLLELGCVWGKNIPVFGLKTDGPDAVPTGLMARVDGNWESNIWRVAGS